MSAWCTRSCRIAALTFAAAALNWLPLPIAGGAQLLLAPFFYMPAVLANNAAWAPVIAGLAYLPTLMTLNHPFVLVGAMMEALWLALLRPRLRWNALLIDLGYWLCLGLPVAGFFYFRLADLPPDICFVVLGKQAVNQVLAVGLADFLLNHTRCGAWLDRAPALQPRLRSVVFSFVFVLAMVPFVVVTVGLSIILHFRDQRESRAMLTESAQRRAQQIDLFLQSQQAVLGNLAGVLGRAGGDPVVLLEEARRTHPHFLTMLIADAEGLITHTAPADRLSDLRLRSIADREYFTAVRHSNRPYVSGVFRGRGFGRDVLIAISAPVRDEAGRFRGIVEASVDIQRFGALVAGGSRTLASDTIVADGSGRVIYADARTGLDPLVNLRHFPQWALATEEGREGLVFDATGVDGRKKRFMAHASRCKVLNAVVIVQRPLLAWIGGAEWIYALMVATVAAILATAVVVTRSARNRFAVPLERFARSAEQQAATGQPKAIDDRMHHPPYEVALVFSAFNRLAVEVERSHGLLASANRELDARVAERTRELEVARLQAEAASRSKTEFLAMTSHEIRTPLNAIIGLADTLVESKGDEEQLRRLRTIRDAGSRLVTVLNDLLDLSRVEAGKLDLHPGPVELGELCRDICALFVAQAERKGLQLELVVHGGVPLWVQTDASRLQQILINLVSNAIKFTAHGRVILRAEEIDRSESAVTINFGVIDTGPGIPLEKQSQLFDPYVQLKGSVSDGHGAGLGLAISRRLVSLLGGSLQLRSDGHCGAEFHFALTLRRVIAPAAPAPVADADPVRRLRVLAADDNVANQEVLRSFLETRCSQLDIVDCAHAAIEKLRDDAFDVALIDLEMPGGDGYSVATAVRGWANGEQSRACRLFAVSAHPRDHVWERCVESGFDGFIEKPIKRQQLLATLANVPTSG